MNTRKIFGYGARNFMRAFTVMFAFAALSLTGCGDVGVEITGNVTGTGGNTDGGQTGGGNNTPATITYTVAQDGGDDNTADSTGIVFTFSASVDSLGLTAADITVGGKAAKGANPTLTGTGTTRTLAIAAANAGWATVSITKTGIEAGTKNVIVFKAGETAPTLSGITAVYTGTAAIYPTAQLNSLKTNLTVTAQYSDNSEITLSANEYTLTGTLTVGLSTITVSYTGNGVTETTTFDVTVTSNDITYTVTQDGGVDEEADSTGIKFTFSAAINSLNLTAADITIGGKAAKGANATLTGTGTTRTLSPITVSNAGLATVTINKTGIEAGEKQVVVFKEGEAAPQTFTVTFNADGGSPAPQTQTVSGGETVSEPTISKNGFVFDGWYKENTFDTEWDFDTDTVDADTTLYAKWLHIYTVTFNSNGGTSITPQTVIEGGMATAPSPAPTKSRGIYAGLYEGTPVASPTVEFIEWRKQGESAAFDFDSPITGNITLIAQWTGSSPVDLSSTEGANIVAKAVNYVNSDSSGTAEYTLVLGENVTDVETITFSKNNVTLTITSIGNNEVVISKGTAYGAVFNINDSSSNRYNVPYLVINGYVTLQGRSDNNAAVVNVNVGGTLELKGHAKITGNNSGGNGGGVMASGFFNPEIYANVKMSDYAEISANYGGGVYLGSYAKLTMGDNAAIKNNTNVSSDNDSQGGGVYIGGYSTFTMNGGEISGNTAQAANNKTAQGGGVYISDGSNASLSIANTTVQAGIKDNTVTGGTTAGAQVYKHNYATFTVGGVAADTY